MTLTARRLSIVDLLQCGRSSEATEMVHRMQDTREFSRASMWP